MEPVSLGIAASILAALSSEASGRESPESLLGLSPYRLLSREQINELYRDFSDSFSMAIIGEYASVSNEEAMEWASGFSHVRFLGSGANRLVFQIPNGVLKFPAHRYGGISSCNEERVWGYAPRSIRELLVPVVDASPKFRTPYGWSVNWVLMDQVIPWSDADRVKMSPQQRKELTKELNRRRYFLQKKLNPIGISDIRKGNMSLDGRLMDYGMWEFKSSYPPHHWR